MSTIKKVDNNRKKNLEARRSLLTKLRKNPDLIREPILNVLGKYNVSKDSDLGKQSLMVNSNIHIKDGMLTNSLENYLSAGFDALHNIKNALDYLDIPLEDINSIIDLPCGYGRVSRWFDVFFPDSSLYCSDIIKEATDFCADTFNAFKVYAEKDPNSIDLYPVDLIWVGSLFTHLAQENIVIYIKKLISVLNSGGVLIFTLHGQFVAHRLRTRNKTYGLVEEKIISILKDYNENDFGFSNYHYFEDYGISINKPRWLYSVVNSIPEVELIDCIPKGWVKHQDLVVLRKK